MTAFLPAGVIWGAQSRRGLESFRRTLERDAPALPETPLEFPQSVIGVNTEHCKKSGTMFGYAQMVDGMVRALSSEMGGAPLVVATGGFASVVSEGCESFFGNRQSAYSERVCRNFA